MWKLYIRLTSKSKHFQTMGLTIVFGCDVTLSQWVVLYDCCHNKLNKKITQKRVTSKVRHSIKQCVWVCVPVKTQVNIMRTKKFISESPKKQQIAFFLCYMSTFEVTAWCWLLRSSFLPRSKISQIANTFLEWNTLFVYLCYICFLYGVTHVGAFVPELI